MSAPLYPYPPRSTKHKKWTIILGGIFATLLLLASCASIFAGIDSTTSDRPSTTEAPTTVTVATASPTPSPTTIEATTSLKAPEPTPEPTAEQTTTTDEIQDVPNAATADEPEAQAPAPVIEQDPAPVEPAPISTEAVPAPVEPAPVPAETTPAAVPYKNCAAARAAGAAPIYAGQPGYGAHLDRDGDGIACEK